MDYVEEYDQWYCYNCREYMQQQDQQAPPQQPMKQKSKKLPIIVFIIVILIIASLSYVFYYMVLNEEEDEIAKVTINNAAKNRELKVLNDVPYSYLSQEETGEYIRGILLQELEYLENFRLILDTLCLFEYENNLTEMTLNSQETAYVGLYDVEEKEIFLLDDMSQLMQNNILIHEFTHALQDQHFDLTNYRIVTSLDERYARIAVYEGDATYIQMQYQLNLSSSDQQKLVEESLKFANQTQEVFYVFQELGLYPYLTGFLFISQLITEGGWDFVNDAYTDYPPVSTEQILHIEKYLSQEAPKTVTFTSEVENMDLILEDTLGEFLIYVMLGNYISPRDAEDAAEGWGGDRLYYYQNETDYLSVFKIEWDTNSDAIEFNSTYRDWMVELSYEYQQKIENGCFKITLSDNVTTIYQSSDPESITNVLE